MTGAVDHSKADPADSRKNEYHEIIENRNRRLSELYLVHHLNKIRSVSTEEALKPIKDSLEIFLQKNNLETGHKFNWEQFKEEIDSGNQVEGDQVEELDQNKESQELVENGVTEVEDIQIDEKETPIPTTTKESTNDEKINLPSSIELLAKESVSIEQPTSPKPASTSASASTQPVQVESQTHLVPPSRITSQSLPSEGTPQAQESVVQSPSVTIEPPSQKTSTSQIQSSLIQPPKKKRKTPDSHISLYDPNNRDAIDTTVLILKEFLPAKVAESTPLAELYYLAQTLPLVKLIPSSHKVVTSNMFESALTEGKINVVHSRIEELKRQGKWSLRQPSKFTDPIKANKRFFWDNLLSEMSWMATDFKEERKLRLATCAYISHSIADYWKFGKVCCIKRKPIKYIDESKADNIPVDDVNIIDSGLIEDILDVPEAVRNEDLDKKTEDQTELSGSIDISKILQRPDPQVEIGQKDLPTFTMEEYLSQKDESPFKFSVDTNELNPDDKTLLDSLPTFGSFQLFDEYFASAPLVPVSKVVLPIEDENFYSVYFKNIVDETSIVPDQQKGLFGFSSQKKLSTSIKPPSPPNLKYLDLRTPTIWLPEDDQDLIEYVNQFSFNWGVVSAHLSKRPTRSYSSNIERRTPWQCFERYIQLNDTFQINDMRGSNTMNAMKWLEHAHNIQATTKRRISPLGVGVESIQRGHKRLRWASMFEAIRKCMRKRESITRPNINQVRKQPDDKKISAPSPAELSKLKYERDKAIQDAYLQNSNSFRGRSNPNVASSRPISGSAPQPQQTSNSQGQQPQVRNGQAANNTSNIQAPGGQTPTPSSSLVRTNSQGPLSSQSVGNSQEAQANAMKIINSVPLTSNVTRPSNAVTGNLQGQKLVNPNVQPYTPEQLQQLAQLRQRKLQQQQQLQQQNGGTSGLVSASSSPNLTHLQINQGGATSRSNSNPVPSPSLQQANVANNQNRAGTAIAHAGVNGNNGRKLAFVPSHVSAVISQIQTKNPNLSKAEVTKLAAQYLANLQTSQNRAAAAAAAANANGASSPVGVKTPQISTSSSSNQQQHLQQDSSKIASSSPVSASASISPQLRDNALSRTLTPQQRAQLDMLKTLRAEQQQKRQQKRPLDGKGVPPTGGNSSNPNSKNDSSGGN